MIKQNIKTVIDALMSALMLFLMGYGLGGNLLHESVGSFVFVLFILHHILNINSCKNLFKGRYSLLRSFTLCTNILVLIFMLLQMYSGIAMSRYIFGFLNISTGMVLARKLHILGAYWGFIFMSLHLGIHWDLISGRLKKAFHIISDNVTLTYAVRFLSYGLSAYGVYSFISLGFYNNLFLKNEFIFIAFGKPEILLYLNYISIAVLFVCLGNLTARYIKTKNHKR